MSKESSESEKIILNKDIYPGNSIQKKVGDEEPKRVKRSKVATARRVKKSFHKRFFDTFLGGDTTKEVGSYIVHDVVVPAAKGAIADLIEGAIEMVLFNNEPMRNRHVTRNRGRSYISYSDLYNNRTAARTRPGDDIGRRGGQTMRSHNVERAMRISHDFSGVVLGSRSEAEQVLGELADLIEEYGMASISDFYDLVGLNSTFTDNKYGWFDLTGASTKRIRDGWMLDLPRPHVIE